MKENKKEKTIKDIEEEAFNELVNSISSVFKDMYNQIQNDELFLVGKDLLNMGYPSRRLQELCNMICDVDGNNK